MRNASSRRGERVVSASRTNRLCLIALAVLLSAPQALSALGSGPERSSQVSCDPPPLLASTAWFPRPGAYRLEITQREVSKPDTRVLGLLHIVCAPGHWSGSNLYGWTTVNMQKLRSAISVATNVPPPDSSSPDEPGVLLSLEPRRIQGLFIGSVSNIRPKIDPATGRQEIKTDGGGVFLTVESYDDTSFSGSWSRAGIAQTGSGHFRAKLARD